uniref:Uncharacterized protein n=1 Tax=Avena sativa TaxID=4498 RepID=A0ACD5WKW8_AVESA
MESGDEHAIESDSGSDTDRISELPEDILQKILSSVRIRAAVRMRRLSRRWRELCESLQFIHLDYRDFEHWKVKKFARFVNNLLLVRQKVDLHTFQLHWDSHPPLNCNDVRMWIGYAVKNNVKVLDVKLRLYDKTDLPPGIFTCRSLQELNLQWGEAPLWDCKHTGLVLPDMINLPSLKRLTLRDVEVSDLSLKRFIARSPSLEDIHLIDSAMYLDCIASTALKRLTLDGVLDGRCVFKISAPHLISFECTDYPLKAISWKGQPSLESARIDTCGYTFDGESKFTGVLAHAKKLALFGADIKVMLEKELPTCSVFASLTTLEIGDWYLSGDLFVVIRFLQLSPRLEKLTFRHRSLDSGAAESDAMPIGGITFQCPFLESVIIHCSAFSYGVAKLVNVMFVNGISEDKINFTLDEDIKERERLERICADEERSKELSIFEKMAKENPEWIDDDPDALSEPDSDQSDAYSDESDSDQSDAYSDESDDDD